MPEPGREIIAVVDARPAPVFKGNMQIVFGENPIPREAAFFKLRITGQH